MCLLQEAKSPRDHCIVCTFTTAFCQEEQEEMLSNMYSNSTIQQFCPQFLFLRRKNNIKYQRIHTFDTFLALMDQSVQPVFLESGHKDRQ